MIAKCSYAENHTGSCNFVLSRTADFATKLCDKKTIVVDSDPVDKPAGYTYSAIEPIDVIEAWELGFCLGNAAKYIARCGRKPNTDPIEDLKKAVWYIQRRIKQLENKQ